MSKGLDSFELFSPFSLTQKCHVVCLVSGGVDSMALLELCHRFQKQVGFQLSVLHVNYHLRGEESDRDESFVRAQCLLRDIPLLIFGKPLAAGSGIQSCARRIRYDLLDQLWKEKGWTHAFTAHHADDQAETVLMRLHRGAGTRGLAGIQLMTSRSSGVLLCRPLLEVARKEIEAWAFREGISFVTDSSNQKTTYFRNQIRHEWLPILEKESPDIVRILSKSAKEFSRARARVEALANDFLVKAVGAAKSPPLQNIFSKSSYENLPNDARFLVMETLLHRAGFQKEVGRKIFDEIESLLHQAGPFERDYGWARLAAWNGCFTLYPAADDPKWPEDWQQKIAGPGAYFVEPLGGEFQVGAVVPSEPSSKPLFLNNHSFDFPVYLRTVRKGDRFQPLGSSGQQKISDYLINKKIPRFIRRRSLVLCDQKGVLALVGHEIDNRAKWHDFPLIKSDGSVTVIVFKPLKNLGFPLTGKKEIKLETKPKNARPVDCHHSSVGFGRPAL